MSKDSTSFVQELSVISDNSEIVVKGKTYTINVMPLAYVKEYLEEKRQLFVAQDNENIRVVMYNFGTVPIQEEDGTIVEHNMEPVTDKWVQRLLEYAGKPCTLDTIKAHKWSIVDFNEFLKKALAISG
jgi:hypothetical protein